MVNYLGIQIYRQPYVPLSRNVSQISIAALENENVHSDVQNRNHNMAIRYRFFNRLDPTLVG